MAELVTLERFGAAGRHYHVYRVRSSSLDHTTHVHNYFQICYVTCGEILHRQGGEEVPLGPGDAFIVPPGIPHSLHFRSDSSEVYSLAFEEELFHPGFHQSNAYQFLDALQGGVPPLGRQSVRLRVVLEEEQRKSMDALMECLTRQQDEPCPPGLSTAPSFIAAIVYLLAQGYYRQPQNARQLSELVDYGGALLGCTRYIDQHYREPLTVTGLARQFGMSRSVFCTRFPQFAGVSLRRYIARRRITEAQRLIRSNPELPLGRVAAEVGYEELSTFYRNFLRISGVSPSKYRELCLDASS